jgi:hypothetical protein
MNISCHFFLVIVAVILLSANLSGQSKEDSLILKGIRTTYSQLETYKDSGSHILCLIDPNLGSENYRLAKSETAFEQSGNFKFSFELIDETYPGMFYKVYVLQKKDSLQANFYIKRGNDEAERKSCGISCAIASAAGVTSSTSFTISKLLMDSTLSGRHPFEYNDTTERLSDEKIDGIACYRFRFVKTIDKSKIDQYNKWLKSNPVAQNIPPKSKVTVIEDIMWFDKTTKLLIKREMAFSKNEGVVSRKTFRFFPDTNGQIDPSEYSPPTF